MFINLTPHPVVLIQDGQAEITIPASGTVARLPETAEVGEDGVTTVTLGAPAGLPDPAPGVTVIVSMPLLMGMVAAGIHRPDVVYPYGQVRDGAGRIVGCRGFARIAA